MTDQNTLNEIMDRNPLQLSDLDIDVIIAYQRKQRAQSEPGVRGKAAKRETGPGIKLDLAALGLIPKAVAAPAVRRRV